MTWVILVAQVECADQTVLVKVLLVLLLQELRLGLRSERNSAQEVGLHDATVSKRGNSDDGVHASSVLVDRLLLVLLAAASPGDAAINHRLHRKHRRMRACAPLTGLLAENGGLTRHSRE